MLLPCEVNSKGQQDCALPIGGAWTQTNWAAIFWRRALWEAWLIFLNQSRQAYRDKAMPQLNSRGDFSSGDQAMKFIKMLFRDQTGATAIEYGLIAALIAVAAIAAMQGLGGQLSATFNTTSSSMSASSA